MEFVLKQSVEPADIGKTAFKAEVNNGHVAVEKHIGGIIDPQRVDILGGRLSQIFFHRTRNMFPAFSADLGHTFDSFHKIFPFFHFLAQLFQPNGK